ncbi:hypothetical protein COO60DRAFT_1459673 [Scenedesmus sp. NREL 46B-D3]|nr:hypothetical protein COO60DRAFT_1459673 [Scenedesmus sp. NREL 46B-D3]
MQDNDQHSFLGAASADLAARTAGGKPKTREVKARYLQAKPTPASRRQLPAASRSSQAFQSAPAGRASVPGPQPPLHDTTVGGALISPGSSRSSTSCSLRPGHDVDAAADNSATHTRHHGSVAAAASGAELQTPQVSRLAASMGPGCQSAVQLGRMGMSVDIGSAMRGSSRRPSDKEAAELKAKLEAYKASKQQQSARGAPVSGRGCSQGAFKAPAPKTMFKGAAASMAGLASAGSTATPGRTQLLRRASLPGSATKIPTLNLSAATAQQRQQQHEGVGMAFRDAPPSRLPKTPRGPMQLPAAGHAAARQAGQEGAEGVRQQLRLLRMQHLQLRHLNSKMETALEAKNEKANTAIAAAAAAVVDLCGELQALRGHLQQEQWRVELEQVLQRQLPKLQAWADLQAQHSSNLSQLQAACRTALSHVPLLNGASVGHHLEAPDLELLQRQLVHGMQLLQEVQPALQQLLGADLDTVSSKRRNSDTNAAAAAAVGPSGTQQGAEAASGGQQSISAFTQQPHQGRQHAQSSIKTTAALAEQLMSAASEECSLLGQLAQQLSQLSDLHLYANSMQVQLEQMKQAAVVQRGI